jgi:hypothetical protein
VTALAVRRELRESPYAAESEASRNALMQDGKPPRNLAAAIAWFRAICADETPWTLHKSGVWRDYGMHAEGGSALGSPAPSEPFRRFLENNPSETDAEGFYVRPLRAALSRMTRHHPLTARHLFRLALVDGDWHRHAANEGFHDEEMYLYLERALFLLWKDWTLEAMRVA